MTWAELYSEAARPTLEEIDAYAHTPLWPQLRAYLAAAYGAGPRLEYSRCGLEPGWNVKFRRGSKSLCTVYLRPGFVTAMVSVAPKDEEAAQMVLLTCTAETQAVYHRSAASKMGRWLMLDITSPEMLEDVKALLAGKGYTAKEMKHTFPLIAADFANIPVTRVPKVKVGVVGEIYVKYSPLGNNDLQKFLESQDCEVNFPGLMGFVQYCAFNMGEDHILYGGKLAVKVGIDQFLNWLDSIERAMLKAESDAGFYAPGPFKELVEKPKGIISLGAKMGEGWLLTAEMIELVQGGYGNIVCAQPFGCLPNHICGKGMINKIRTIYPRANITPIDYDPGATRVNQENRIKLMLSVAKERLGQSGGTPPQGGAAEKVPVYGGMEVPAVHVPGFAEKLPANG